MEIRDRIVGLRRVRASLLRPHPQNWRVHPKGQRSAVRGLLKEIGYADALLARELSDGTLELVDGHLRAEITPAMEVPVLIVDLDDAEAAKLLLLHDPLAGMAEADDGAVAELMGRIETESSALGQVLDRMLEKSKVDLPMGSAPESVVRPCVVVECRDEAEQEAVFRYARGAGLECNLRIL